MIMNKLKSFISKLFIGGNWNVCFKLNNEFHFLKKKKSIWAADPFIIKYNNETYIFAEVYDVKHEKGAIGYASLDKFQDWSIVLEFPFHSSYPFLFEIDNNIYMIPETGGNKEISLFIATSFPNKWEKMKVLEDGKDFVDSTYFTYNGISYLYTVYNDNSVWYYRLYEFDNKEFGISLIKEIQFDSNIRRPAGGMFNLGGTSVLPFQNNVNKYGESISYAFVEDVIKEDYFQLFHFIDSSILNKERLPFIPKRIHTFNSIYGIEIYDFFVEKIDIIKPIRFLRRRLRRWKNFKKIKK